MKYLCFHHHHGSRWIRIIQNQISQLLLLLLLLSINWSIAVVESVQPEQIHISLGANENEMIITWHTIGEQDTNAYVVYHRSEDTTSSTTRFATPQVTHLPPIDLYTYRAALVDLEPATFYNYRIESIDSNDVGALSASSASSPTVYQFRTIGPENSALEWMPTLAVFGDLGVPDGKSIPYLSAEAQAHAYDAIFHLGDIAYDLQDRNGNQGNDFMRAIEPIAARVPYMVAPGNHEEYRNFSHYDARYSMIDRNAGNGNASPLTSRINNHFYSFDLGPTHIVVYSTEYYYYGPIYGWAQIERQYRWLTDDLEQANRNRARRPWIIAMGHRPMYCAMLVDIGCNPLTLERTAIRDGVPWPDAWLPASQRRTGREGRGGRESILGRYRQFGLEELFHRSGVDLIMTGHEHLYARLFPVFRGQAQVDQTRPDPYDGPLGPVHITTGSAGNREHHPPINPLLFWKNWYANFYYDYGYTRLRFADRYRLVIEQISVDQNGRIIDNITIQKYGNYPSWLTSSSSNSMRTYGNMFSF